jgi:hypothetical protein
MHRTFAILVLTLLAISSLPAAQPDVAQPEGATLVPIGPGYARTGVNAVIFRRNSVVTHREAQYAAYYDPEGRVVLAKRTLGSDQWRKRTTQYSGNVRDAHNSISIVVDGDGYLHMAWDHHGHPLRYCRSVEPGSLELSGKMNLEDAPGDIAKNPCIWRVTYPEFYRMADGNLLLLFRHGASGRGNLVMYRYDLKSRHWTLVHENLIDGQGQRNAYWQACTDTRGTMHLSWCWREHGGVETNHDLCYARSTDGGKTWTHSNGTPYTIPINADTAEYALRIPQNSTMMNQTSMCADSNSRPYIVNYWADPGSDTPQYRMVYHDGKRWKVTQVGKMTTRFQLRGGGTKSVPLGPPMIVADTTGRTDKAYMIFRADERGGRLSMAICPDLSNPTWNICDLTDFSLDRWEPSCDTELWKREKKLHVYAQTVGQGDGERTTDREPTTVSILEWNPDK